MQSLEDIEAWLGQALPEPYRSFLQRHPQSQWAADDRTLVYGRDVIVERNDTYESRQYCPGHIMVADDSGGVTFVLSLKDGSIHAVDMGAMTPDCFDAVAPGFAEWAEAGFRSTGD